MDTALSSGVLHSVHSMQQVLLPALDALAALLPHTAPDGQCMDSVTTLAHTWAAMALGNLSSDALWHAGFGWGSNASDAFAAGLVVVRGTCCATSTRLKHA